MEAVRLTDGSTRARSALVADLAALLVFVLVGLRSHHEAAMAAAFARTAIPFVGAWLVASAIIRTYRPARLVRLVKTWAIAVPAGVVLRAIWVGSEGSKVVEFLFVAMAFTLLFLLAGRLLARSVVSRSRSQR